MGNSNNGSNSGSDADTQEPVKVAPGKREVEGVEDSDEEVEAAGQAKSSSGSVEGKMRQIIDRINADSDCSDDDDPLPADALVDFGDEEEEEEEEEPARPALPVVKPGKEAAPKAKEQAEEQAEEATVGKKDSDEGAAKKKTKGKKDIGPAKTIKKGTATGKAKPKAARGKAGAGAKKKDSSPKPKSAVQKKSVSPNVSPKTSPKPQKKTSTKIAGKAAGKDSKARAKAASKASTENAKNVKPKKVIVKEEKKPKKTIVKDEKKGSAVKTFSKKANAAANAKTTPKSKKVPAAKKVKAEAKVKKAKGNTQPATKSSEEEEEDGMVVESEGEASESSDAEMEETARTPASKLPILGNLACSSRDNNCTALLDHAVEQLGKYNVVSYGADSDWKLAAYVIGKDTKRGWGLLQALANGIPLVSDDWLSSSISEGKWKPIDMFRSDRFGQSPRSVDGAVAGNGRILDGTRVKVLCQDKDAGSVRKVLRLCGARVAETRMDVIVNDTGKSVKGCVNVAKKWLADSVEAGMALDYGPYVVDV